MKIVNGVKAFAFEEICEATNGFYNVMEMAIVTAQLRGEMEEGIHFVKKKADKNEVLLTKTGCQLINDKGYVEAYSIKLMEKGAQKLFA